MDKQNQVMKRSQIVLLQAILWGWFVGCGQPRLPGLVEFPPPHVSVARPVRTTVERYSEFTGWTEAAETVEVRSPVDGVLIRVSTYASGIDDFQEGTLVHAGDLLFAVAQDLGQLGAWVAADAARRQAKAQPDAGRGTAPTTGDSDAQAALVSAQEKLDQLKPQLRCVEVRAAITGRIGKRLVAPGNLVSGKEHTLLTTIVSTDPIHVCFPVEQREFLELQRRWQTVRREEGREEDRIRVSVGLLEDEGWPYEGRLDFLDHRLDQGLGTAVARAVLFNKEGVFYPGMSVRLRLSHKAMQDAMLIDDRAIGMDLTGRYVLVVQDDDTIVKRYVELGELVDGMRVIRSRLGDAGLDFDDRYVVDGLQRARPGLPVMARLVNSADRTLGPSVVRDTTEPITKPATE